MMRVWREMEPFCWQLATVGAARKAGQHAGAVAGGTTFRQELGRMTQLEFHAPQSVKIHSVFKDSSKLFKNARKG
jgi:hypothetical protein